VESVEEYSDHFPVLEIDFTFYRLLLDQHGQPTQNFKILKTYAHHLKKGDHILLKVPQVISGQKIHRGGQHIDNESYLNPRIFIDQFYDPATKILGDNLTGFIFEQEYQRKEDRTPVTEMAKGLDRFFQHIPKDYRYHLELRTDLYLRDQVFEVLEKHGIGQVLSHWTWLPPLRKQLAKADGRFFNSGKQSVIRLMTPLGMRYEAAYERAYPFDRLTEGMLKSEMILDTVEIMKQGIEQGLTVNVIVNNRAGGNAPLIAQMIAEKFLPKRHTSSEGQKTLW
jgi:uncharacterized protein YecE (DUF72 family)